MDCLNLEREKVDCLNLERKEVIYKAVIYKDFHLICVYYFHLT